MVASRPRFAVYLRISRDPDGTSTAPERQLKDCRAFAKLRDWDIVAVHRDADVSAYRTGVKRPKYDELLAGIRAGAYDGVLVWRLDRLVRRTVEFADFWRLADACGVRLASATQPVDTGDPVGMLIVHILVAFAEMESATMSARILARERELADNGHNKTAGWRKKRSYGHEAGWEAVHEPEAEVIREIARRLLDGESIRSVYVDLNAMGLPAPGGGRWSRQGVVALMRSARLFGWRDYKGELTATGDWPAIISEADGRALRALFDRPANTSNRRRHLLSGLLRCGRCGGPMRAGRTTAGVGRYMCLPKAEGGCGAVSILMDPTDDAVDKMVIDQLETPDMAVTLRARRRDHDAGDEAGMLAELHQLKQRTDENAADRALGAISRAAYLATQQAIDRQTEILSKRLADQRQPEPLDALAAGNGLLSALTAQYRGLPAERRRGVIESLTERITVLPVDDPTYLERLRVTLTDEAADFRAEAADLRARAKDADPDEAQQLRRQAEKRDADARRRVRQIARGGNAASVFRVERIDPVWRV